ncbi:MAG: YidC/Oxa1 family insertase periplasmic-domain containing protein [Planctomycetota bacterium]|jgi:YidC/Oxa1 family membrane protein insertase
MDQDTLRNLLIAAGIFLFVMTVGPKLFPPPPEAPESGSGGVDWDAAPAGTTEPPTSPEAGTTRGAGPPPSVTPEMPAGGEFSVVEAEAEETRTIGTVAEDGTDENGDSSPYRMGLVLSNVGASVESATMSDHAEAIDNPARYELLRLIERDDGTRYRSLAVERINVDDVVLTLHDKKWNVGPVTREETVYGQEGEKVKFWIDIHQNDEPALRVTRTLTLPRQSRASGRHDVESNLAVENLSGQPHRVLVTYRGGLGVRQANPRWPDRFIDWGVRSAAFVNGNRKPPDKVAARAPEPDVLFRALANDPGERLSWAATANTYFTCTIAPLNRNRNGEAEYINRVAANDVDGLSFTDDDVTVRFVTRQETIQPGGDLSYPADIYLGQKDARAFKTEPDYRSRNYYYQISQGFGWCTFTWLVELMIWLLNSLFVVVRDFGVAIMVLVLVVRALLHPITKKGQVNMVRMQSRMQELAPKIEEIKKKYANDKARLNQEMMKLNINPAGQMLTCLPMMIQMPIWIALYLSLSNNILMRHEPCVFLPWIHDLTAPDALWTFSTPIVVPIVGWVLPSFNLLPILVAVFMYTQQKLQPKPAPNPNMTDQQRQQQEMMQKMMPMMSIMMLLIFYKMPSGLNLYIMSSSLFGTIEQKRIRAHIKEQEAAGTLHKPAEKDHAKEQLAKKRRKPSFFKKLQAMAEEAQKAQAQRPPGGKRKR